jgi:comEA protein
MFKTKVAPVALRASVFFVLFSSLAVNGSGQKKPPSKPLDLNAATLEQLEQLPGVGPETAKAIVEFREKSGPFQRVEDLRAVKGISKKRLEALRPYVTVGPPAPRPQ